MTNEISWQTPVTETVDGEDVQFPRLTMGDLMKWAADVKRLRINEAKDRLAANNSISAFERERLLQHIQEREVEVAELLVRAYSPSGVLKVVMTSLQNAKVPAEQAKAIVDKIHFERLTKLAEDLMTAPRPKKDAPSPPLAASGTGATGDSSAPSSENSAESNPIV